MSDVDENDKSQSEQDDSFPTISSAPSSKALGSQIGPYKLLSVLGEGGFGMVYLAEQYKPVRRRVALKVIKPGMDTKQVIARFEAERQALAMLDHQNIAHVFDAGTTEAGRPYFAMELVKGLPITEYCDQHKLGIEERLDLFQQVCDAVQHAHQKGIIHRDLKPSNILVLTRAEKPVPMIIDFGVAKAINQPLTERTLFTEQGQFVGTPEYMSPEQAGVTIEDIDTRSDVFSLGIILYELLTGTLPFTREELKHAGFAEIQRTIREVDPPRPSTRLSSLGDKAKTIAEKRCTELATLTKRLHKELEWIPVKAMRKEPDRRYQTASELAQDIHNYLKGDPLLAGPESASYRLKKAISRNRALVIGIAAVLAVLIAGIVVSTIFAFGAMRARKAAEREKNTAVEQKAEAEKQKENAVLARTEAEQAKLNTEKQKEIAEQASDAAEEELYVNQITSAQRAIERAETGAARNILTSCSDDMRNWEWYYLWNVSTAEFGFADLKTVFPTRYNNSPLGLYENLKLMNGALKKFEGHKSSVENVEFSSDGKYLFSINIEVERSSHRTGEPVSHEKIESEIKIWDIESGKEIKQIKVPDSTIQNFCVDPTGHRIAMLTNKEAIITDLNGTILKRQQVYTMNYPFSSEITWSPDGKYIAFESRIGNSFAVVIEIWDIDNDKIIHTIALKSKDEGMYPHTRSSISGSEHDIYSLVFSPDSKSLVVGTNGSFNSYRTLRIWDVKTGKEQMLFGDQGRIITTLSFSPDGKYLADIGESQAGSGGGHIHIWDFEKRVVKYTLAGHTSGVYSVSYSPDGKRIATVSNDKTIRIWNSNTGKNILSINFTPFLYVQNELGLRFSPDGKSLAVWGLCGVQDVIRILIATSKQDMLDLEKKRAKERMSYELKNISDKEEFSNAIRSGDKVKVQNFLTKTTGFLKEIIQFIVENGADISGDKGIEYLEKAVDRGNPDAVLLLLQNGVDIKNDKGRAIFQKAFRSNRIINENDTNIIKYLITYGADFKGIKNSLGQSILHYALMPRSVTIYLGNSIIFNIIYCVETSSPDIDLVKALITKMADINVKNNGGNTPLWYAIRSKDIELIKTFIENGADVNTQDNRGNTLLHGDIPWKNEKILELLQNKGANINKPNNDGLTPLQYAVFYCPDIVQIIKTKGGISQSALIDAIIKEDIENVKAQIVLDPNEINLLDVAGNSLLHYATALQNYAIAEYLIDTGINVDTKSKKGYTALHLAIDRNNVQILELILRNSANVNTHVSYGSTLFDRAIYIIKDENVRAEVVRLLLKYKADINLKDGRGNTILHKVRSEELTSLILSYNPDLTLKNADGLNPLDLALKRNKLNIVKLIKQRGGNASDPVLNAVVNNDLNSIEMHLKKDPQIAYYSPLSNVSLIYLMACFGDTETIGLISKYGNLTEFHGNQEKTISLIHNLASMGKNEMIEELLKRGVGVDSLSWDGDTPLIYAALFGQKETVLLLIKNGADIHIKDKKNGTCLHAACRNGHDEIVRILVESGADINAKGQNDLTSLHLAANEGHEKVVKILLEKGADPIAKAMNNNITPLDLAKEHEHKEIVKLLSRE